MTGNTSAVHRLEIDEYNNIMVDLPVTHPLYNSLLNFTLCMQLTTIYYL